MTSCGLQAGDELCGQNLFIKYVLFNNDAPHCRIEFLQVQVCDATMFNSSNIAWYIILIK
jgi:hypothetical protein